MKTLISLILTALLLCPFAVAQAPAPDTLVSPTVNADRTVTFRIRAPKASQVTLYGDWMPVGTQQPMVRDDGGVWSITAGPLDATVHLYSFTVDGITIADPINPNIKLRQRTSASLVEVPAQPPAVWQVRDVPHGSVDMNWQRSTVLSGDTRQIWVYLPPGYEKNPTVRYPVLYLLHGSGDTPAAWTMAGNANIILDNLIADKKSKPMIVIMPGGHAVPYGSAPEIQAKNTPLMEEYMIKEVMPWAESKYRIQSGRQNHAIAGLSMGGGQTLNIGFAHLDRFSHIGVFSSAAGQEFADRFKSLFDNPKDTNAKLKVFWIGIGDQDRIFAGERAKVFFEILKKGNLQHTRRIIEGGAHTWPVWRLCLSEFAPLLFH
jgi:enterochelin esterase-like enzyme